MVFVVVCIVYYTLYCVTMCTISFSERSYCIIPRPPGDGGFLFQIPRGTPGRGILKLRIPRGPTLGENESEYSTDTF